MNMYYFLSLFLHTAFW